MSDSSTQDYGHNLADWDAGLPGEVREGPPVCFGCGRVMSRREAAEQGACNDCNGGAW